MILPKFMRRRRHCLILFCLALGLKKSMQASVMARIYLSMQYVCMYVCNFKCQMHDNQSETPPYFYLTLLLLLLYKVIRTSKRKTKRQKERKAILRPGCYIRKLTASGPLRVGGLGGGDLLHTLCVLP
ncbi:hypothetical protein F4774DRAFT_370685 [Daldinia eschscholtzii]|nr:hypothetical protein F4774DRAFT_370685 [Daldinia eschscholtzii]